MTLDLLDRFPGLRRRQPSSESSSEHHAEASHVKRALFGRGNTEENLDFCRREMENHRREREKRWNYDFEHDRPKEGRYEWTTEGRKPVGSSGTSQGRQVLQEKKDSSSEKEEPRVPPQEGPDITKEVHKDTKEDKTPLTASATATSDTSSTSTSTSSTSSSRASQRQSAITAHFTSRRKARSRSKVKVQERKSVEPESPAPTSALKGVELLQPEGELSREQSGSREKQQDSKEEEKATSVSK